MDLQIELAGDDNNNDQPDDVNNNTTDPQLQQIQQLQQEQLQQLQQQQGQDNDIVNGDSVEFETQQIVETNNGEKTNKKKKKKKKKQRYLPSTQNSGNFKSAVNGEEPNENAEEHEEKVEIE